MKISHCTYFFAAEYAAELRGKSFWETRQRGLELGYKLIFPWRWMHGNFGNKNRPKTFINTTRIPVPPLCRSPLIVFCMPARNNIAEVLEQYRLNNGHVIIDVVADTLGLVHPDDQTPDAKAAGDTVPQETWDWWYAPERQQIMRDCLAQASAVTCSFAEYVPGLREITSYQIPVHHVPDLHVDEPGSLTKFNQNMVAVLRNIGYDH